MIRHFTLVERKALQAMVYVGTALRKFTLGLFQILAISAAFTGCTTKPMHITIGLTKETVTDLYKHRPVQVDVKIFETDEVVRVTVHRDDKRGK